VIPHFVRIKLEQDTYDRARQAAEADRRSLANWVTVTVERALEGTPAYGPSARDMAPRAEAERRAS
jgi:hypothetical protein